MPTQEQYEVFQQRVDAYEEMHPGYAAKWQELQNECLRRGGDIVVPHLEPDKWCTNNLDRFVCWNDYDPLFKEGERRACHENSGRLLLNGEADFIVTGYGLSTDGLWRQHSWGLRDGHILETTEIRTGYMGIRLSFAESLRFVLGQGLADELEAALEASYEVLE